MKSCWLHHIMCHLWQTQIQLLWVPPLESLVLKSENTECKRGCGATGNGGNQNCWWERRLGSTFSASQVVLTYLPVTQQSHPLVVTEEMATRIHVKICTWVFTTALRVGAKNLSAIRTDKWIFLQAGGGITRPHEPKATESQSIVEGAQGIRLNERRYTGLRLHNSTHVMTSQKPVQINIEPSSCFWKVGNELTAQTVGKFGGQWRKCTSWMW